MDLRNLLDIFNSQQQINEDSDQDGEDEQRHSFSSLTNTPLPQAATPSRKVRFSQLDLDEENDEEDYEIKSSLNQLLKDEEKKIEKKKKDENYSKNKIKNNNEVNNEYNDNYNEDNYDEPLMIKKRKNILKKIKNKTRRKKKIKTKSTKSRFMLQIIYTNYLPKRIIMPNSYSSSVTFSSTLSSTSNLASQLSTSSFTQEDVDLDSNQDDLKGIKQRKTIKKDLLDIRYNSLITYKLLSNKHFKNRNYLLPTESSSLLYSFPTHSSSSSSLSLNHTSKIKYFLNTLMIKSNFTDDFNLFIYCLKHYSLYFSLNLSHFELFLSSLLSYTHTVQDHFIPFSKVKKIFIIYQNELEKIRNKYRKKRIQLIQSYLNLFESNYEDADYTEIDEEENEEKMKFALRKLEEFYKKEQDTEELSRKRDFYNYFKSAENNSIIKKKKINKLLLELNEDNYYENYILLKQINQSQRNDSLKIDEYQINSLSIENYTYCNIYENYEEEKILSPLLNECQILENQLISRKYQNINLLFNNLIKIFFKQLTILKNYKIKNFLYGNLLQHLLYFSRSFPSPPSSDSMIMSSRSTSLLEKNKFLKYIFNNNYFKEQLNKLDPSLATSTSSASYIVKFQFLLCIVELVEELGELDSLLSFENDLEGDDEHEEDEDDSEVSENYNSELEDKMQIDEESSEGIKSKVAKKMIKYFNRKKIFLPSLNEIFENFFSFSLLISFLERFSLGNLTESPILLNKLLKIKENYQKIIKKLNFFFMKFNFVNFNIQNLIFYFYHCSYLVGINQVDKSFNLLLDIHDKIIQQMTTPSNKFDNKSVLSYNEVIENIKKNFTQIESFYINFMKYIIYFEDDIESKCRNFLIIHYSYVFFLLNNTWESEKINEIEETDEIQRKNRIKLKINKLKSIYLSSDDDESDFSSDNESDDNEDNDSRFDIDNKSPLVLDDYNLYNEKKLYFFYLYYNFNFITESSFLYVLKIFIEFMPRKDSIFFSFNNNEYRQISDIKEIYSRLHSESYHHYPSNINEMSNDIDSDIKNLFIEKYDLKYFSKLFYKIQNYNQEICILPLRSNLGQFELLLVNDISPFSGIHWMIWNILANILGDLPQSSNNDLNFISKDKSYYNFIEDQKWWITSILNPTFLEHDPSYFPSIFYKDIIDILRNRESKNSFKTDEEEIECNDTISLNPPIPTFLHNLSSNSFRLRFDTLSEYADIKFNNSSLELESNEFSLDSFSMFSTGINFAKSNFPNNKNLQEESFFSILNDMMVLTSLSRDTSESPLEMLFTHLFPTLPTNSFEILKCSYTATWFTKPDSKISSSRTDESKKISTTFNLEDYHLVDNHIVLGSKILEILTYQALVYCHLDRKNYKNSRFVPQIVSILFKHTLLDFGESSNLSTDDTGNNSLKWYLMYQNDQTVPNVALICLKYLQDHGVDVIQCLFNFEEMLTGDPDGVNTFMQSDKDFVNLPDDFIKLHPNSNISYDPVKFFSK